MNYLQVVNFFLGSLIFISYYKEKMKNLIFFIALTISFNIYSQNDSTNIDYLSYYNLYEYEKNLQKEMLLDSLRNRFNITNQFNVIFKDTSGYISRIEIQSKTGENFWYIFENNQLEDLFQKKLLYEFYDL